MPQTPDCLDEATFRAVLNGSLSTPAANNFRSHLGLCLRCRSRYEEYLRKHKHQTHSAVSSLAGAGIEMATPVAIDDDSITSTGRLDHYQLLSVRGRGGFGVVFKAFDEKLHRIVAVKVLDPALVSNSIARLRFIREARSAAAVSNEHVVTIHAVNETGPMPYLVMEWIDGESLQERLQRSPRLPSRDIIRIAREIVSGLAAAHSTGLIHRDIKPANILLEGREAKVKITDFGLARTGDDPTLTGTGQLIGTPLYMSPEQAAGEKLDPCSDWFSLGTVLYVMCTGQHPFHANNSMGILKKICENQPTPISSLNPNIPEGLSRLIARLHEKAPRKRLQSASEILQMLECLEEDVVASWNTGGIAEDTTITYRPTSKPAEQTSTRDEIPRARFKRTWIAILGVGVVLVLSGIAIIRFQRGSPAPEPKPGKAIANSVPDNLASASNPNRGHPLGEAKGPEDARALVRWALQLGAKEITLRVRNHEVNVRRVGEIVDEPCDLLDIDFRESAKLTDAEFVRLRGCRTLRGLDLRGTQITDQALEHLLESRQLVTLHLERTGVTDRGLSRIVDFPYLSMLDIGYTKVSPTGLTVLKKAKKLYHLNIEGIPISEAALRELRGLLPGCTIISGHAK